MDGPPYTAKEPLVPPLPSLSIGPNTTPPFCGFKPLSRSMKSASGNDLTACGAVDFCCATRRPDEIKKAMMQIARLMNRNLLSDEILRGRPKSSECLRFSLLVSPLG